MKVSDKCGTSILQQELCDALAISVEQNFAKRDLLVQMSFAMRAADLALAVLICCFITFCVEGCCETHAHNDSSARSELACTR